MHAYVIMSNHVHLIVSAGRSDVALEDIMRDHKKFTSRQIVAAIDNPAESRRSSVCSAITKLRHYPIP